MLKNYFKIAIAVLKRRKFFTFISLFGISFTLTILIVLTAFLDHLLSAGYPDVNRSRELFINGIELRSSKDKGTSRSPLSFSFFHDYVRKMKTPAKLAIYTGSTATNAYQGDKKIVVEIKYTNTDFWSVYQYDFIEGKSYNQQQLINADKVAVISEESRSRYFGEDTPALGKYIEANNTKYKVIGVVKSVSYLKAYCFADIFLPYTLSKDDLKSRSLQGGFSATILVNDEKELPAVKTELAQLMKRVPNPDQDRDLVFVYADTFLVSFTRGLFGGGEQTGETKAILFFVGIIFLFMLLPTINLVNINISRIMERSSEIGVRKAFGASSKTLTYQFIVENLLLTFFGGLLGLILSSIVLYVLNDLQLASNMYLKINLIVLFYSFLACLVFGLFSGVYPAWRMSKLNVVTALKANN